MELELGLELTFWNSIFGIKIISSIYSLMKKKSSTYYKRKPKSSKKTPAAARTKGRNNNFRKGKINQGSYVESTGLPETFYTKLKYYENGWAYSLPAGSLIDRQQIRINDPRDPYPNVGGKSALYYQFWSQVYRYCRVKAAKVTITWVKTQDANDGILVGMVPNWFNGMFNDMDDVSSQPRSKISTQLANRIGDSCSMSYYIKINTLLGMTELQYDSQLPGSDYDTSNTGGNPVKSAMMDIYFGRLSETSTATALSGFFSVKVIFYCKFFQRYPILEPGFDIGDTTADDGEVDKSDVLPEWVLPEDV